jgi:hypothetical protein
MGVVKRRKYSTGVNSFNRELLTAEERRDIGEDREECDKKG